jgi:hypothetical protein
MIKSLNKTLPPSSKPLNRPLRGQDCLRTRRDDLGVRLHTVGAAALYQRVLVGLGGKIGVGRYNSTTGRKSPLFDACRQIYPENFGQGFKSGRRQEMLWTWDPLIFVLDDCPHFMWERCAVGCFSRADFRVSQVRGQALYKFVH